MPNEKPRKGDSVVFFDIETLPALPDDPLWLHLQESGLGPPPEERMLTALNAPLGRVWMIGWAPGNSPPEIISGDGSPESEEGVLRHFWECLEPVLRESSPGGPWWVGYNISGFDLAFLQVRALKWGMPHLAAALGKSTQKPWERREIDLAKIWPRTGADRRTKGMAKLDTVCRLLGIPHQPGLGPDGEGVPMGPDVPRLWEEARASGDPEEAQRARRGVEEHLRLDVLQVRELFKRLWHLM